jgi:FixJ family two-component response regulator
MFNITDESIESTTDDNERLPEPINPIVYIVDDDRSVRMAIERLLVSAGIETYSFESAVEFLASGFRYQRACLIADVYMTGLSGIRLIEEMKKQGKVMPVILITGFGTAKGRLEAMRIGTADYVSKPVDNQTLLDTIQWAINDIQ